MFPETSSNESTVKMPRLYCFDRRLVLSLRTLSVWKSGVVIICPFLAHLTMERPPSSSSAYFILLCMEKKGYFRFFCRWFFFQESKIYRTTNNNRKSVEAAATATAAATAKEQPQRRRRRRRTNERTSTSTNRDKSHGDHKSKRKKKKKKENTKSSGREKETERETETETETARENLASTRLNVWNVVGRGDENYHPTRALTAHERHMLKLEKQRQRRLYSVKSVLNQRGQTHQRGNVMRRVKNSRKQFIKGKSARPIHSQAWNCRPKTPENKHSQEVRSQKLPISRKAAGLKLRQEGGRAARWGKNKSRAHGRKPHFSRGKPARMATTSRRNLQRATTAPPEPRSNRSGGKQGLSCPAHENSLVTSKAA